MPLYRLVPWVPVFHRLLAAETTDTISRAREVETSLGQSFGWHLLHHAGALK